MKIHFLGAIFIFWASSIFSQTGVVVDKNSKQPLANCSVYFPEYHSGTTTNNSGEFFLKNFSVKNITIQISLIGYQTIIVDYDLKTTIKKVFELAPNHMQLQEVIVATPKGKLQKESIANVERKDIKTLKQNGATTLIDALTNIAGVEQQSTGVAIGKPTIRGLSGNRIVVYAQDVRQENQQWGDEHGLGIGEVGIEAVEVIKGPSSLLYGSDALGGVIYFVDERFAKENSTEMYVQSNYQTNNQNINGSAAFKTNAYNLKLNVFGSYNSAIDYKIPDNYRVYNTRFYETNFKTAIGYNYKKWIGNLKYSYVKNNFGITEDSNLHVGTQRNIVLPFQQIANQVLSSANTVYLPNSTLQIIAAYSTNYRNEFQDTTSPALSMKLHNYLYNAKWTKHIDNLKLTAIVGLQGMYQTNRNFGSDFLIPNGTTNDIGIYGLINGKYKEINYLAGVRLDYRNLTTEQLLQNSDTVFTALHKQYVNPNFSVGVSYAKNNFTVKANIANGFRSPNFGELSANGAHEGTNRYEIGNHSLKIENAIQTDVSIDYNTDHLHITANPFINKIYHYIFLQPTQLIKNGLPVYIFNQANAMLYGGELGFHYHPHQLHWLHFESNISTIFGKDENKNNLPLIPATRINTTIKAEVGKVLKEIFINHIYKFSQDKVSVFETPTPNYQLLNAGFNMELNFKQQLVELSFIARNIFNETYIDHLSRFKNLGLPAMGNNYNISIKYSLSFDKANSRKNL